MANTNCLQNLACPNCGNEAALSIKISLWCRFTDEGAEDIGEDGDLSWYEDAPCRCPECHHIATVEKFTLPDAEA